MSNDPATRDVRAKTAFGHSYGTEAWAVKADELAWLARLQRLRAFRAQEIGNVAHVEHYEKTAAGYEKLHADWVNHMAALIVTNEKDLNSEGVD
jgi:hypothetical protein